jgi:hypothetical protein
VQKPKRPRRVVLRLPHPDAEPDDRSPQALADWRWALALDAADDRGDLRPLADCFAANLPLSDELRNLLVRLLAERRLDPRQRVDLSPEQRELLDAATVCKAELKAEPGKTLEQIVRRKAKQRGYSEQQEQALRELASNRGRTAGHWRRLRKLRRGLPDCDP